MHALGEYVAQRALRLLRQRRELKSEVARRIGRHGHIAARGAHREHAAAAQRPAGVKYLQCLAQARERLAAGDPGLSAEGIESAVGAGERAGVRAHRVRGSLPCVRP